MADELDLLLALATVDRELVGLKKIRDALPVDEKRQAIWWETAKANLAEVENARREMLLQTEKWQLEAAAASTEIKELEQKFAIVKNQKEYTIITERIADLKKSIAAAEEQQLAGIAELENIEKTYQEKTRESVSAGQELEKFKCEAAAKVEEIKQRQKELVAERNRKLAAIEKANTALLALYNQCLQRGKGIAMAKMVNGVCVECHRRVSPNLAVTIATRQNSAKNLCLGCGRLLYAAEAH